KVRGDADIRCGADAADCVEAEQPGDQRPAVEPLVAIGEELVEEEIAGHRDSCRDRLPGGEADPERIDGQPERRHMEAKALQTFACGHPVWSWMPAKAGARLALSLRRPGGADARLRVVAATERRRTGAQCGCHVSRRLAAAEGETHRDSQDAT